MKKNSLKSQFNIAYEENSDSSPSVKRIYLEGIILSVLLSVAFWFSFPVLFRQGLIPSAAYLPIIICPALFYTLFIKFGYRIPMVYILLLIAAFCSAQYSMVWNSCLSLTNHIMSDISLQNGVLYIPVSLSEDVTSPVSGLYAFGPMILLIACVIAFCVFKNLPFLLLLLTSPILIFSIFTKADLFSPSVLLLIFCWILALIRSPIKNKRNRLFFSGSSKFSLVSYAAVLFLAVLLCLGVCSYLVSSASYPLFLQQSQQMKDKITQSADSFRYDANISYTPLPNGNLTNTKPVIYTENPVLTITMEKPASVYLRTFIGAEYGDSIWRSPSKLSYNYMGIFDWLFQNGFYPQFQLSTLASLSPEIQSGHITIQNTGLSGKYIYAPYQAGLPHDFDTSVAGFSNDGLILSKGLHGRRSYSFDMVIPSADDYAIDNISTEIIEKVTDSARLNQYLKFENTYRAFVYDNYLSVPEKYDRLLHSYFSDDTVESIKTSSYRKITAMIRRYFSENYTYSLDGMPIPKGYEALESFLKNKQGYQVHYATLATLLFREAGIPARYAEGYHLSSANVMIYEEMKSITFELPDSSAHAWTEIYLDKIGWIPVEVTPGFFRLITDEQSTDGIDDILIDNPEYFYLKDKEAVIDDLPPPKEENLEEKPFPVFLCLLPIVCIIGLALVSLYLYKRKLLLSFSQNDSKKAALAMYEQLIRLMNFKGIDTDYSSENKVLSALFDAYPQAERQALISFIHTVFKARFSAPEQNISSDELIGMNSLLGNLSSQTYKNSLLLQEN